MGQATPQRAWSRAETGTPVTVGARRGHCSGSTELNAEDERALHTQERGDREGKGISGRD